MMHLVLIHPITPTNDEIVAAIKENADMKIYLVDPKYVWYRRPTPPPPALRDEIKLLHSYGDSEAVEIIGTEYGDWKAKLDGDVVYVSYIHKSAYEIIEYLRSRNLTRTDGPDGSKEFTHRYLPTSELKTVNLARIVRDYKDIPLTYNPFAGGRMDQKSMSGADLTAVKGYIRLMCRAAVSYISNGFDHPETLPTHYLKYAAPISDWMFNVETPPLRGLIEYYGLKPPVKVPLDRDEFTEMRESGSYRQLLCDALARVLATFAVNNQLITLPEVTSLGGWSQAKVYQTIESRV